MTTTYKILFISFILAACSDLTPETKQQTIENISYAPKGQLNNGYIDGNAYHNDFFSLSLPTEHENWTLLNKDQYSIRLEDNKKDLNWNDKEFEKTKSNNLTLLTLEKYYDTPQGKEQYINFMAEGLDSLPNVSNAIEYLYWTDSFLKERHSTTYPKYKTLSIDTGSIGNRKFLVHTLSIEDTPDVKRYQKTYCAQYGKFLLNIIVCYYTDDQLKDNFKVLNKISWD